MFKILFYFVLVLMFGGCVSHAPIKPSQKTFAQEDTLILFALRAEQVGDYESASKLFEKLYDKSTKKEYLYRFLQDSIASKDNEKVIKKVNKITQGKLEDTTLIRLKIIALVQMQKLRDAKKLALSLVSLTKEADDYILLGDIYIKQKKFDTALKYLESAYTKNYNEKILDKMAIVLYVNLQRKKDAIAQLETHTRIHGCSKTICMRLAGFYSNDNNVKGLLSAYLRLYRIDKNEEIAKRIVQIYGYEKEYIKLIDFLEESKINDELLLDVYVNLKNYKKASVLAKKLYEKTGDIKYLGQNAIFDYESVPDKNDKDMQARVVLKLKKVVEIEENPLYLNYLGYLLVDHKIDIQNGIKYIKRALKVEPESAYYLDSLAWGYYQLGKCKKAYDIIKKVTTLKGGDDKEVLSHLRDIKSCIINKKQKRGKSKR